MAQTGRPGLAPEQMAQLWQRWKAGQSMNGIGQALGRERSSIHYVVRCRGGIAPVVRRRSRLALTLVEREDSSRGIAVGCSIRKIADELGRSASTVSREAARTLGSDTGLAIPATFISVGRFSDGFAPVQTQAKPDRWGFIGPDGKLAIKAEFDSAGFFSEGLAPACVGGAHGRCGYIDKSFAAGEIAWTRTYAAATVTGAPLPGGYVVFPELARRANAGCETARRTLARFLNASSAEEIIWACGRTEGIKLVASTWARAHLRPGDELLLAVAEHTSNLLPWRLVAESTGARVRYVDVGR